MTSLPDDAALACALAQDAGRVLLEVRSAWSSSADGHRSRGRLRAAADAAAQRVLAEGLAAARPDDLVLSEEAPDPRRRLAASRVWIVDPLDGTREYGEPGRTDWAVHVALWADGALVAAAVALPALGEVYSTDGVPRRLPTGDQASGEDGTGQRRPGLRLVVSRSRPPAIAVALAEELGADLRFYGSVGVKAAVVWRGEADAYVHTGGLHEWDAAAPVAVARAAGLHASRLDGAPLEFNRPEPVVPDLLICAPRVAESILTWTARGTSTPPTRTTGVPMTDVPMTDVPLTDAHSTEVNHR